MSYKVIQWATGIHGRLALRGIIDHPDLELVGVKVYGDDKHGVDAGALCDRPATGVLASKDATELMALEADGLVARKIYAEVPPRVEYSATADGLALRAMFQEMHQWWLDCRA